MLMVLEILTHRLFPNCKGENEHSQWRNLIITTVNNEATSHFVTLDMKQHIQHQ